MNLTDYQILTLIRAYPDKNIYQLTEAAKIEMPDWAWSTGKVHKAVQRLKRDRKVTTKYIVKGGRSCQQVTAITV